ncbi:MAG: phosphate ABC transporter permease subunit PstC [Rhodospirillales bacterium]|nr:phosphate ABC transporter permease subunit PstC [Rhodospirillales bacterium]
MNFRRTLIGFASVLPASLIAVILFLAIYYWPAVKFNGLEFIVGTSWNLGNTYGTPIMRNGVAMLPGAHYGILFLIAGTLLSTLIALLIAVPVGVGAAIFLAEAVPGRLRLWLSFLVELLAAVPSVVFGLWGYAVLIPLMGHTVFPIMQRLLGFIPFFAGPTGSGYGLLTAGVVLALMIVPLIAATLRDAILAEPMVVRESAAALGATRFETVWQVVLPGVRKILIGVTILATGRALGETMAVLMVSGNALNYLPPNIYSPISTMAAFIVSQLDSALQDPTGLAVRSLAEVALVLSVISVGVNTIARLVLYRAGLKEARL